MPRRKKRAAWASIAQVEPSVYRIRYWAAGPDGYRRRSKTVRGTRKDAERARSELMLAHSEDAPCPTVGDVWERWALPDFERRVADGDMSANSLRQYRYGWNAHVAPRWGAVQCSAVRALDVQQWLYGLTLGAARQALPLLRMSLDYATKYEFVGHNVAREKYQMPAKATMDAHDKGVWTYAELGELWRRVRGMWLEPAFLLCAFGGLRVGEALGVRSEDVTECHGCALVSVRRQVGENGVTETLKTPQSRREVPIPGRAGTRLLAIAAAKDGWLTDDRMGGTTNRYRLHKAWSRLDVPEGMRHPFRNLRNSWQTWMRWTMRMEPWAIETLMGHKFAGVTGQHYDRPTREVLARMVADAYRERPYDAGWNWTS